MLSSENLRERSGFSLSFSSYQFSIFAGNRKEGDHENKSRDSI